MLTDARIRDIVPADYEAIVAINNATVPAMNEQNPESLAWLVEHATYARVVMDGEAKSLRENEDVREFYLGIGGADRRSFRDVKSYKRRKRWLA